MRPEIFLSGTAREKMMDMTYLLEVLKKLLVDKSKRPLMKGGVDGDNVALRDKFLATTMIIVNSRS